MLPCGPTPTGQTLRLQLQSCRRQVGRGRFRRTQGEGRGAGMRPMLRGHEDVNWSQSLHNRGACACAAPWCFGVLSGVFVPRQAACSPAAGILRRLERRQAAACCAGPWLARMHRPSRPSGGALPPRFGPVNIPQRRCLLHCVNMLQQHLRVCALACHNPAAAAGVLLALIVVWPLLSCCLLLPCAGGSNAAVFSGRAHGLFHQVSGAIMIACPCMYAHVRTMHVQQL